MTGYVIRRLLALVPVLALVGVLAFLLLHATPSDPAAIMAGDLASKEQYLRIRGAMGLDKPFVVQIGLYFKQLLRGDLGTSIFSGKSVVSLMAPRLQATIPLALYGEFLAIVIGLSLGVLAAWRARSWIDRAAMAFSTMGYSMPIFWLGFNLIWLFSLKVRAFPVIGYVPLSEGFLPFIRALTLPALTCGLVLSAIIVRMTRSSMLEVLSEDYIRTARAKGLRERTVIFSHALKAAANPIITIIGLQMATMVTGVIVVETVFGIPGLGRLVVDAITRRDFPVIQGMLIVVAVVYVLVNLLIDLAYTVADPRIRY